MSNKYSIYKSDVNTSRSFVPPRDAPNEAPLRFYNRYTIKKNLEASLALK